MSIQQAITFIWWDLTCTFLQCRKPALNGAEMQKFSAFQLSYWGPAQESTTKLDSH